MQGQIKQLLTGLMLNTPPLVRAQLSEALTLISSHDFPAAWPQLLPELVERLAGRHTWCSWRTIGAAASTPLMGTTTCYQSSSIG